MCMLFPLPFLVKLLQLRCSNGQHKRWDVLCQMQRDMSWVDLPLCLPCHIFSVAYVKDRRLSGGPGTSSSLFTSDLLTVSFMILIYFEVSSWIHNYFGLLWNYFWPLLSFMMLFFDPEGIQPHFCVMKNVFPSCGKISFPHFLLSRSSALASSVLLFAWPSAVSEQKLLRIKWSFAAFIKIWECGIDFLNPC